MRAHPNARLIQGPDGRVVASPAAQDQAEVTRELWRGYVGSDHGADDVETWRTLRFAGLRRIGLPLTVVEKSRGVRKKSGYGLA